MKIKILKHTQPWSWYKDRIGEIFNVLETDDKNKIYIVHRGRVTNSYVDFDDAEILNVETLREKAELVCYTCDCTKGTNAEGNNYCNLCDHYF